ncbi:MULTISPECIES: roadblock/LC7 domain-containing protein [Thermomonospora]|uniref:Roadblock/LC7 family protein n=1 Tax=Thermomonospora curvata (strain ATCC 19995 / DSM 43183 / JCM 3096 / KCTC 9072 / NBRC 15933 / NCIMB 10081 / Henssen B9) TaxID=471852 RepID=D1AD26_THECD|nr:MULTISPECIES: roadblock/LC7 domain-containing protein [Thermomonospora]ACY99335.1 Roadblock/LC7 family protein [Thermomonospora curvata DSM 43183]PKK12387.1 MAG: dynein regulation protein LC7 [Thermomonospora sp. CIF 1]
MPNSGTTDLTFLLDDLVKRVDGARHAIVLSADGLLMASDSAFAKDDGEHLAAVAAGVQSLARGVGERFGHGKVRQSIIEMETAFLLVTVAGPGACLAVLADQGSDRATDVGLIAYEMALLVTKVSNFLTSPPRAAVEGERS